MKPFISEVPMYKAVVKAFHSQASAKARTSRTNMHNSKDYIGRGIRMCSGFKDKWNFLAVLGPCPPDKTLDRIDNNAHYSCGQCEECSENGWPMNCQWATAKYQALNRRNSHMLTLNGVTKHAKQWSVELGICQKRIHRRKLLGWSDVDILTKPILEHPVTTKINREIADQIRKEYAAASKKFGVITLLASKFGLRPAAVSDVINRKFWT